MNEQTKPSVWNIRLDAWIIQDGNYPDFAVGQTAEFAIEFFVDPSKPIERAQQQISAIHTEDSGYDVVARSLLQEPELTILDMGILVYSGQKSEFQKFPIGTLLRTRLSLSIDPYDYFRFFSKDSAIPPLIYSWNVLSIHRQTAPFVELADSSGRKMRGRDLTQLGYENIGKTNAWSDDEGFGEYILCCELLPFEPKRTSATAI
jgi:hypothetical protein